MKSHMELYGWRIDRAPQPQWFHLWVRGEKFPRAGGTLEHIAKMLKAV